MKYMRAIAKTLTRLFFVLMLLLTTFTSCKEEEGDLTAPGKVTELSFTPTNGGAIIRFKAPDDEDLLYIKAAYTNSRGKEVFKVTSHFGDSIEIVGFNDELPKTVRVYAVDRSNNHSEPSEIQVTPLKSYIYLVQESIELKEDLGGVRIKWNNPAKKTVFVYVYFSKGDIEYERILSSNSDSITKMIRGLDPEEYNFSVMVEDFDGNKTETVEIGKYQPLLEQKIDKSTWVLLQNLSVDGDKWEGSLVSFWDDVVDTKEVNTDNSYFIINREDNGGMLRWPLDIVVDLNKTVVVNRFVVWQRAFEYINAEQNGVSEGYYYYKEENMRSFSVSISNDKLSWSSLGTFDIGDPRDEAGEIPPSKMLEAINGHEFNLETVSEPFRYLKFSVLSNYGSETNVYGSEITLFGLDNQ